MRIKRMSLKVMVWILIILIINSVNLTKINATEDNIVKVNASMNIDEYRHMKQNTLTRSFNYGASLIKESSSKMSMIKTIKSGLDNLQRTINLDLYVETLKDVNDYILPMNYFFDTLNEYPEIFYPELTIRCSYSYNKSTNKIISYSLLVDYQYDNDTINSMKNNFNKKINYIKENYLSKAKDDLEKEYIIHDYIIRNCKYDYENLSNLPTVDHTSYGALVNGIAVCDGYSRGAKVLFDLCNIESGIVESDFMNHAWNYVNINGKYYNLDITWNDRDIEDFIDYSYFNISNYGMSLGDKPHTWNVSNYPSCVSEDFNFLREGNLYIRNGIKLYTTESSEVYIRELDGSNYRKKVLEDLNDDGIVNLIDLSMIANSYNSSRGQEDFNYRYDLDNDGIIDIFDICRVSSKIVDY